MNYAYLALGGLMAIGLFTLACMFHTYAIILQ